MATLGAPTARIWVALAIVYVIWGSTYLGIDLAVRTIPPFLMAAIRFLDRRQPALRLGDPPGRPRPTARRAVTGSRRS